MKKSIEPTTKTIHVKISENMFEYLGEYMGMAKGTAAKCIINYVLLNKIPISEVISSTVKHYRGIR